jgi:(p)ppGpp synthase/HD superfamily hydrolase
MRQCTTLHHFGDLEVVVLQTAVLHDTIEDTETDAELPACSNDEITGIVLTSPPRRTSRASWAMRNTRSQ